MSLRWAIVIVAFPLLAQQRTDYVASSKSAITQKDYAKAERDALAAVRASPNSGDAHRLLGTAYFLNGKLTGAITEFQTAIRLNPRDANAYYNLGIVYYRQSKWNESLGNLNQAIRLNSKDAAYFDYRANVYDKLQNKKAAEADRLTASSLRKKTEVMR